MECSLRTTKEKILTTGREETEWLQYYVFSLVIRKQSQRKSYKMKSESLQKTPRMKGNGYFE